MLSPVGLLALPATIVHLPARTAAELRPHDPAPRTRAREDAVDFALDALEIGAVAAADDGVRIHGGDAPGAVGVEGDLL